jgi:hypothetical protein
MHGCVWAAPFPLAGYFCLAGIIGAFYCSIFLVVCFSQPHDLMLSSPCGFLFGVLIFFFFKGYRYIDP